MARELTLKQKRVLSTLEAYWTQHHVPPSISDLARQLGVNKATAYEHLLALKKKGYLVHQARAGRTWRPVDFDQKTNQDKKLPKGIPLLGRVSAGLPVLAQENIEDYLPSGNKNSTDDMFALRVNGQSMINAHIKDNDIVIAKQNASVHNKDIVVALIDNEEATVKRYAKDGNTIKLIPENDNFDTLELSADRVAILGKVVEVRRKL